MCTAGLWASKVVAAILAPVLPRWAETVQRGLKSRSYDQGRFSVKRENGVHHFQTLVYEWLGDAVAGLER